MTLYELHRQPQMEAPALVVALDGWIDAGLGAGTAAAAMLGAVESEVVATFDTDALLDHRARRPILRIRDGVSDALTWPTLELRAGHDSAGVALLMLVGPEPDHQWKAFAGDVAELAARFSVRILVGLGAFPAPVPHTRPARLAATASTEELAQRVGFVPGTLDVPAGAQAALERQLAEAGVPAVGLWARVPHYAAAMPYPEASALLLEGLKDIAGITVDTADLRVAADATRVRLDELVAESEEHSAMVRQLEAQVDAETAGPMETTSGDQLAAEVERFLRDQS
jgi:predicted ATP-grasp superfamily ATP-dependent carboligase